MANECHNSILTERTDENVDYREALFNSGETGPIQSIQVSTNRITTLRGILFDIDPKHYRAGKLLENVPLDPREFYQQILWPWLSHHPLLSQAEVRCSGTGLHVLLWFEEPVQFREPRDREEWDLIIKVVQAVLPVDPDQPALTAVTRPVGSINGKDGSRVSTLKQGEPVTAQAVQELSAAMFQAPFATVLQTLTGETSVSPCPVCGQQDTQLSCLGPAGKCYSSCGQVSLSALYDLVLQSREEVSHE